MHVPILINSAREQTVEITYLEHVLTFSVLPVDTDLFVGELVMHDTNDRKLLEDRAYQAIAPGDAHHLDCPELDTCLKFSVPAGEPQVLLTGERGVHPTVEINLARIAQAIGNVAHSAEFRLLADDEEGRRVADAVGPLLTEYEQLLDKRHERKRHLDDEEDEVARKRRGDYLDYIARRITHTLLEACPASETASDSSRNSDMSD